MIRTNVPARKLETSKTEQTITHVNGRLLSAPLRFKNVTVLVLGTVLVYSQDGTSTLWLQDNDRVNVQG